MCLSVCLSAAACLHYCTDPDVTSESGRECRLVVHYWADLQSVHGLHCYDNITRTRNASEYMLILALCLVGSRPSDHYFRSVCLSAAARPHYCTDPDVTSGSGGICPLVVPYWADLQSVHGLRCCGNITRTRNVSEYMFVLALCLVVYCIQRLRFVTRFSKPMAD